MQRTTARHRALGALAVSIVAVGAADPAVSAAPEWLLMARHGECTTLEAAAEQKPIFAGVATPEDLIARLRQEGGGLIVESTTEGDTRIVRVTASQAGIAVIFVPPKLCP